MRRRIRITSVAIVGLVMLLGSSFASSADDRSEILKVREPIWRAWFANDTKTLQKLVPSDAIVISAGEEKWKTQAEVLQSAAEFRTGGGELVRLEFPRTEMQRFGGVAIIWSTYLVETETNGKRSLASGRITEIFVRRHGQWVNAGWHTDSTK
jgi:ketosteroid isomerase-like protein